MADNIASGNLVVTTSAGDYYVIPVGSLEQFRATDQQRQQIDALAGGETHGSFVSPTGAEAASQPGYASTGRTTAAAWFDGD